MLTIRIPAVDFWDESKEEFVSTKEQTLCLEHSLVSISKWESKWHKPFLSKKEKTIEEILDYIKCMTITQNINPDVYGRLTNDNIARINDYIDDSMTATWFSDEKGPKASGKVITSEVIYYWMVTLNIPFECQKWHLNRLLTLIRVCNEENKTPKKLSRSEILRRNAALNAARRKKR